MIGLVGRKVGMTRVFTEEGVSIPVTVVEVEANRVAQVKTLENDGYTAIQVTAGAKKASRVSKPEAGHFAKAGVEAGRGLWEFRLESGEEFQDMTHGNSLSHRAPGSIGQCQTPGRVFKGKKMSGHMGAERVTTQNLEIVRVDAERNLLLIKGAVPGSIGGNVIVKPAVKA